MDLKKARREFGILIERCGCSRASLEVTEKEAKQWTKDGLGKFKPQVPHCTPKKCYPELFNLLYPKGGFSGVSYMVKNYRKRRYRI